MNKERLLRLASRLEKVASEHFNINKWYNKNGGVPAQVEKVTEYGEKKILSEGFCGSVACVLGHAALIKDFNEQGLFVVVDDYTESGRVGFFSEEGASFGFTAGEKFFEIPIEDAAVLFGAVESHRVWSRLYKEPESSLITPQSVAAALRNYVATDGGSLVEARYEAQKELERTYG